MAKRLRFLRDFDFHVKPTVTIAFKADSIKLVPEAAAQAALNAGAAVLADEQSVARPRPVQAPREAV